MGRLVSAQRAREIGFDALLRIALILLAELHADTRRSLALGAFRSNPDDPACDRNLLFFSHEIQQHEHLVTELVARVRRYEEAAVFDEGHVREVQSALVLDRQ